MSNVKIQKEPAKRGRKKITKEDKLKALKEEMDEVTQLKQTLQAEELLFQSHAATFPKIADLLHDELDDLTEELEEMESAYQALIAEPEA